VTTPAADPRARSIARLRASPQGPGRLDLAVAAVYAAVFLGYTLLVLGRKVTGLPWVAGLGPGSIAIDFRIELVSRVSIGLVIVCAAALAWQRSRPEMSFLVICAVGCIQVALGEPFSTWNVAMPAALYSAAAYAGRGFARLALGMAAFAYFALWAVQTGLLVRLRNLPNPLDVLSTPRGATFVVVFAVLVLVWVIGDQVRAARERVDRELERAEQLEREEEANARIGALAERHRIARELHDVVAHGLSVMIVQADGALYAEAEHPDAPRNALATIASTGRESLAEMRRLLGVLRDEPDAAQLAPQPDLEAVPELIEGFGKSGLVIEHRVDGVARPVSPAVGLTAYRVVQESLTNVLHHVGPTRVEVRVAFTPDTLGISVRNDPGSQRPAVATGPQRGLGLVGMRERVGLLGGRMAAGPTPDGGFAVRVEIPDRAWPSGPAAFAPEPDGRSPGTGLPFTAPTGPTEGRA
jgi:signal transduction histidine kinase